MLLTSVLYPLDRLDGTLALVMRLNPMTPIIDGYRASAARRAHERPGGLAVAGVLAFALLGAAWLVFHRAEFQFAENL